MKRAYWLLVAAVPLVLWVLSKGGAPAEPAESSAPPQPTPEPKPAAPAAEKPSVDPVPEPEAEEAGVAPAEVIAPPEPENAAPPVAQAPDQAEVAVLEPEVVPEVEPEVVPEVAAPVQAEALPAESKTEAIQLLDSRDQSYEVDLLDIDIKTARVRCVQELPANEKVRLVIPYAGQAITVNAQMQEAQGNELTLKILTMKAGQKKRFDEYLAQR